MSLTTIDGKPIHKPFFWSYTKLSDYRTCPKKLYLEKITKQFAEPPSEHLRWGNEVHAAMADRIMYKTPLPLAMKQWEHWIPWALEPKTAFLRTEFKMAVTAKLQPCDWFDKKVDVWFRTAADVLGIDGKKARLIDWKTGKVKPDSDQLALMAAIVMVYFPEIEEVTSQFVFLHHDAILAETYTRADIPRIWQGVLPDLKALHASTLSGDCWQSPAGYASIFAELRAARTTVEETGDTRGKSQEKG